MQTTRRVILEYLRDNGSGTVDTLADAVALAPVTVRHHLKVLKARGMVEAGKICEGRGRPRHIYYLSAEGAETLIDDGYEALASRMIDHMNDQCDGVAEEFFVGMAHDLLSESSVMPNGGSIEDRLDSVAQVLAKQGYTTRWEADGDEYVIRQLGCPYHSLGRRHNEVCTMDLHLVKTVTGAKVVRDKWRQSGDELCTLRVIPPNGEPSETSDDEA
jgi:predicted ArsR family transcriptional regulator